MTALIDNQTSTRCLYEHSGGANGCLNLFKPKLAVDGLLERLKVRLVAKRFHQEVGVGYLETYSPIFHPATIRVVLTIAPIQGWEVCQYDVDNAFLDGNFTETVYMEQPPRFHDPRSPSHVCELRKAPNGLKHAPRA